jgi:hypothetical protein
MKSFDIHVVKSTTIPFWYVNYKAAYGDHKLLILRSLRKALEDAKTVCIGHNFNNQIVLNVFECDSVIDINDDVEVMHAILAHG